MGEPPTTIPFIKPNWLNDSFPEPLHFLYASKTI